MNPMRRRSVRTLGVAAVAMAALAMAFIEWNPRAAAKTDPRTYNIKKKVFGKSVGDWTREWWQWYFSVPFSAHQISETTGEFTEVGQRGDVWFFSAPGLSTISDKTATIPTGKALLFPILNVVWDALDGTPDAEAMYQKAAEYIGTVDLESMQFSLDGVEITDLDKLRVISSPFEYHIPEDNIYKPLGLQVGRGIFNPAVSDGYWVFLKPLEPGDHTVHFEVRLKAPSTYALNVTWHLTVVDHNRP